MIRSVGEARDHLKRATAESHRRLDENPWVKNLSEGRLKVDDYGRMLGAYLTFYQSWEEQMALHFPDLVALAGPGSFQKTSWLLEDLKALSVPVPLPGDAYPAIEGRERAIGSWYVVEGSTIGGMHLSRGGKLPAGATRFFSGYGPETMSHWKTFVDLLDHLLPDEPSRSMAAEEALKVFEWFETRFSLLPSRDEFAAI